MSMKSKLIDISGIGLCSSMGGYQDACAAYRAGLNRFSGHEFMKLMFAGEEEPAPLTVAGVSTLYGYESIGRTIKLFQQAYKDLLNNRKKPLPEKFSILIALPEPEEREIELDVPWYANRTEKLKSYMDTLLPTLFKQLSPTFSEMPFQIVFGDRLAFPRILQKAQDALESEDTEHCLLFIADSLLGKEDLDFQLEHNMIKTADNPVGYIPGEGAAMLLVSTATERSNVSMSVHVLMDKTTFDYDDEAAERESWMGKKLFALYEQCLPKEMEAYPEFIIDLNGQEHRAQEYGMLQVMLKSRYPDIPLPTEQVPALGFGELGAMAGPIGLAIILASIERKYAKQRHFIISLSEDSGRRALIKISV